MTLTDDVKRTITAFNAKFPMPVGELNLQNWIHQLCEQLAYSHPADGWGHKASSITSPHSKDTIARRVPFVGFDIIIGAGTPTPALDLNAQSTDLSGQYFEVVAATNWLGSAPMPPPDDLEARVAALEQQMVSVVAAMRAAGASLISV